MKTQASQKLADALVGLLIMTITVSFLYVPTLAFAWLWHANNTADLSQVERVIAINQEEYDLASERVLLLTEGATAFRLNADTPVASLVTAQITFSERLVDAKVEKTELLASIIARCNGPWAPAVWAFDSVPCSTYRTM